MVSGMEGGEEGWGCETWRWWGGGMVGMKSQWEGRVS